MTGNLNHSPAVEGSSYDHCLFFLDTDGQCAYINEDCCRFMGYAREELIAHTLNELGVITDCQSFMSMFRNCMSGKTKRFEATVHRKDGVTLSAEINITHATYGRRELLRCDLHGMDG
jgi:PAS domain S-box-containing protein